ncbi:hypothetical protein D3C87_2099960 [compost metagenome]
MDEVLHEYGINSINELSNEDLFDGVLLAVAHNEFINLEIKSLLKPNAVVYDVKSILDKNQVDGRL